MTTVVWDGKTLAADRRVTINGVTNTKWTKVHKRKDGALIGVAGEICTGSELIRWFMCGEKGKKPPLKANNTEGLYVTAIIVRPKGVVEVHDADGWHVLESDTYALGSGGSFARVALRCGKTAEEAVQIASEFDIYTDNNVDVVYHDS